ncbi:MAG: PIN domain-containing protein [Chloroflexi bacterium]|nr:PIN domain-containing protein [Chloroflexota bacterium]
MEYLADTVAIVRHLRSRRLGHQAAQILREADAGQHLIYISAITLMEILYLSKRRRIDLPLSELVHRVTGSPNYTFVPVGVGIVLTAQEVDDVPELHDRILVATAEWLHVPLITSDGVLAKSTHVQTVW